MKNLFLTTILLLTFGFSYANLDVKLPNAEVKSSIEEFSTVDKTEYTQSVIVDATNLDDRWGVGCYIVIRHNGDYVTTVYAYEFGETQAEATAKCRAAVRKRALSFIADHD